MNSINFEQLSPLFMYYILTIQWTKDEEINKCSIKLKIFRKAFEWNDRTESNLLRAFLSTNNIRFLKTFFLCVCMCLKVICLFNIFFNLKMLICTKRKLYQKNGGKNFAYFECYYICLCAVVEILHLYILIIYTENIKTFSYHIR